MSAYQPPEPKGALATGGVVVGGGGGSVVLGMIVSKLLDPALDFAKDWQQLTAYTLALALLYGWAYLTAKRPDVITGIDKLDGK